MEHLRQHERITNADRVLQVRSIVCIEPPRQRSLISSPRDLRTLKSHK
jgi:hypothetical protein